MVSRFHLLVLATVVIALPAAVMGQKATFLDSFGAPGTGDGQFNAPNDVVISSEGYVYVSDFQNHRIQRFSGDGTFEKKWGSQGAALGQFHFTGGICKAPGQLGDLFVSDLLNHRVQRFSDIFAVVHEGTFGSLGAGNGQFNHPDEVSYNPVNGQVYVVDRLNSRIQRFDSSGAYLGQWGGAGSATGQFDFPKGLAADPKLGNVYVAERNRHRVQRFTSTGVFQLAWGSSGQNPGQFVEPSGLEVSGAGLVYVADSGNDRIQVFDRNGRFLHEFGSTGSGAGQLRLPQGISISADGSLHIADTGNHRIVRYRISDEAPKLVVKGAKSRTVASSSVRLSGTARDDLEVDFVEVKVGSAPFRKAKGSSKWTFTARGLKPGLNRIQIRSVDLGGRKSKLETLRVSRS